MSSISKTSLYGFFFGLLFVWCNAHSQINKAALKKSLAEQCAPDFDRVTERIFANPGGKIWKEYATVKQIPRLGADNGELMIAIKTSSSGRRFVRLVEYGQDSAHYQGNCYDEGGTLRSLHYEMRTAWGWGYEDIRTFNRAGRLLNRSTRFFDTKSTHGIKRPSQADDVPDFLNPTIYKNFEALPITGALKQKKHATPQ